MKQIWFLDQWVEADVLRVLRNLRPEDEREIAAARRAPWTPDILLKEYKRIRPWEVLFYMIYQFDSANPAEPVAILGVHQTAQGEAQAHMLARPQFTARNAAAVVRFVNEHMRPIMISLGYSRVFCRAMAGLRPIEDFLQRSGAERGEALAGYGVGGETFHQYEWRA